MEEVSPDASAQRVTTVQFLLDFGGGLTTRNSCMGEAAGLVYVCVCVCVRSRSNVREAKFPESCFDAKPKVNADLGWRCVWLPEVNKKQLARNSLPLVTTVK